ncbi:hypothetical protein ACGGZK_15910 [Agromyces sp. MMS24-K17]|uniref:hypothetical protein n=1 Tax=Agromyces sp. MMS24-K17 TaxID=3372850 RepID=UPI003754F552
MDLLDAARLVTFGEPGAHDRGVAVAVVSERRPPAPEVLLRHLLGRQAEVPAEDVELRYGCPECGARHGRPLVEYPTTPSGAGWFGDALQSGGVVVAAVGLRRRLGVGMAVVGDGAPALDRAAFHPVEVAALAAADPDAAPALRARMWARKAAVIRALGHSGLLEPSAIALAPTEAGQAAAIVRGAPELGDGWTEARTHDLALPDGRVAAIAMLP